jgi:hypothetical protein
MRTHHGAKDPHQLASFLSNHDTQKQNATVIKASPADRVDLK